LHTANVASMMASLCPHFDWILIDSPPCAPLTDALSWKDQCDATLLVARAGRTPIHSVEEALTLLGRKHVLAILLNAVEGVDRMYKKYYRIYNDDASSSK
jgi:protein-tyrosine kinase